MPLKKLVTNSLNDDAVTAAKVENAINTTLEFVVPAGGIIMWSGSTGSILIFVEITLLTSLHKHHPI